MAFRIQTLDWLNAELDSKEIDLQAQQELLAEAQRQLEEAKTLKAPLYTDRIANMEQRLAASQQRISDLEMSDRLLQQTIDSMSAEIKQQEEVRRVIEQDYERQLAASQQRERELEKDKARLDWLERRRVALNSHYGTSYGWEFVSSHNVNRLFVCDVNTIALHDSERRGKDIRSAIDEALRALPQESPAQASAEGK